MALLRLFSETENCDNPDNSFINRVLDRRLGIPITHSAVRLFAANRLGLPLVGVGMPSHLIVKWQRSGDDELRVDPFHGGMIITREERISNLERGRHKFEPAMLSATGTRPIIARMSNNLAGIYRHTDELQLGSRYEQLAALLSSQLRLDKLAAASDYPAR